ncbi:MAG: dihydroorotate dehydrogenase (quinone) [Candidatus Pacebacteria bacterium CG_4_10_14_3_um_filter_34_15]|nr:dihydroorotate dehydrogenase (quinone) [Candidatus Pacearchaeota archaeon]NCQ66083.1 dihydroorotate dehydrogenase (quinone) [Candidatus Paceibacterota bacterium]OIO45226.1 MAG: dihydroorotate dehydrogenase (quinone) [Candidatus Pacebacteria bacterium CG1_02_43_31]PIQ81098.1 MAG: dihydroorotate dehydrogenase (quinone) [Candidatus Pacebacteria bacterium CG11_big_fil_rev_8_21_14_0_20_34_55]PIX81552.1 MAG: dihydroorotate dehydrogenase (quinone) [Candidatus Pacebacteria bacterium CG_4_10_14_3_um_
MKIILSLLLIVLSIIGIADSSYITYEKIAGYTPDCGAGFDCGTVLNSEWSSIGPIPLSLLGFVFYLTVFILSILNCLDFDLKKYLKNGFLKLTTIQELILAATIFGALFSGYLVFIMAFVIHAWCKYCLISAFTSLSLFIVSSTYYIKYQNDSPFLIKQIIFSIFHFLYVNLLKKIFFLFDAEFIHNLITSVGKGLGKNTIFQFLTATFFSFSSTNLERKFDGITFKNPVGLSAGFDYNGELTGILPSVGFGFHTIGTVTYEAYEGNKKPRLGRYLKSQSLLVNKGFKSLGAKVIAKKLTGLNFSIPTGISIGSTNKHYDSNENQIKDILKTFSIFEKSKIKHQYYELNISCPNTFGGEPFTTPNKLKSLLDSLEKLNISKPIYVKMPIDQSKKETLLMLQIIDKYHVAGVIFGNLTKDKTNPDVNPIDLKHWKHAKGNLSGKPTWNRSNELVALTRKNFKNRFTIIGTGGIFTGEDASKKINYGADLIQLITGMIFEGPQTIGQINLKLSQEIFK